MLRRPASRDSRPAPAVASAVMAASSAITQDLPGWKPTHPGLIEDIEQGHYFS
jgi:hypothetical protein